METPGMKTSFWGPHAWAFLFSTIAGSYPKRMNPDNPSHVQISRAYVSMFKSLKHTLPCAYCRDSYAQFYRELPIDTYTGSRREMMHWLYLMHDKVNQKLIKQERARFEQKKAQLQHRRMTPSEKKQSLSRLRAKTLKTKPSPPFAQVLAHYARHQA